MSIAKETAKQVESAAGNKLPLTIGNTVQHRLTGLVGRVEEVAQYGDQQVVSVRTVSGRLFTKLNRQEFVLVTTTSHCPFQNSGVLVAEPAPLLDGLIGPISDESILGDLV